MTQYKVDIITHEVYLIEADSAKEAEDKALEYQGTDDAEKHRIPDNDPDPSKGGFWWESKVWKV